MVCWQEPETVQLELLCSQETRRENTQKMGPGYKPSKSIPNKYILQEDCTSKTFCLSLQSISLRLSVQIVSLCGLFFILGLTTNQFFPGENQFCSQHPLAACSSLSKEGGPCESTPSTLA